MRRSLARLSIPFREPFVTSSGVVPARELVLLRLEDENGLVGYGEAAPFEPYDGVPLEAVLAALTNGGDEDGLPQARAAEEMARLDLAARRAGQPVGEVGAEAIAVNRTLPAGPPEEIARRAKEGVRDGFACFKVKVGLPDDAERVAAVRAAIGPWPALRVDANGAWTVHEAVAAIESLAVFDLELVEQPCRTLDELAEVRRRLPGVPIAADEPIATAADVRVAAAAEACDAVNVKLAPAGGFDAARATVAAAREHGLEPYLSSTLDGPWGIAAALQLAATERLSLACGLATLELFDAELARALPAPERGLLSVPQGPGLGVAVGEEALAEVLVEELSPT
ncbi:MAG: L-Ala-D/L-Glu epimerase [Thermoleophilaceae bacterium]|nr:L-Ala-D/L-Glu epimerase [Thermoleophilaceae bacterium]